MKRFLFAFGAVVFSFATMTASPPSEAREVYSGLDLIQNCKDPVICDVFLLGLLDSHATLGEWYQLPRAMCPPVDMGMYLIWGLVRVFFDRNEEVLGDTAGSLALVALEKGFPCGDAVSPADAVTPRFRNGIDLVVTCGNFLVCEAFMVGVLDSHQSLADWGRIAPLICLPEEITNGEMILDIVDYLEAHSDQLEFSAASLVLLALSEAYGCS